jgi:hypothetical protein
MVQMPSFRFYPDQFLAQSNGLSKNHQALLGLLVMNLFADAQASIPKPWAERVLGIRGNALLDFLDAALEVGYLVLDDAGDLIQPDVKRELDRATALCRPRCVGVNRRIGKTTIRTNHEKITLSFKRSPRPQGIEFAALAWLLGGAWPKGIGPAPDAANCIAASADLWQLASAGHADIDPMRCNAVLRRLGRTA